jgi:hypothetical protein
MGGGEASHVLPPAQQLVRYLGGEGCDAAHTACGNKQEYR